ncbi:YaeQ family protein [Halomonas salifodinae]|uniref:YaeQ family protein n=1 Tax=Halomonas salifodinae TaxID=438745 RepID=UPI0033BBEC82
MALKSTICKAQIQLADMDRHHYDDLSLTLAQHPSETDQRLMVRLLAYALNAGEGLAFTRGLSTDDEPELWRKDLTGAIELWIELGLPDEDRLRKACQRSRRVILYAYGEEGAVRPWWDKLQHRLSRFDNLVVWRLPAEQTRELAELADRSIDLQCNIQEGQVMLSDAKRTVILDPEPLLGID